MMTLFNYDAALAAVRDNAVATEFLKKNRTRLEELGTEAGQEMLLSIIDLFASGKNLEAWRKFYGRDTSWGLLGHAAAQDVVNTAAMSQRWADVGVFLRECGLATTKALLAVVVAGFCT